MREVLSGGGHARESRDVDSVLQVCLAPWQTRPVPGCPAWLSWPCDMRKPRRSEACRCMRPKAAAVPNLTSALFRSRSQQQNGSRVGAQRLPPQYLQRGEARQAPGARAACIQGHHQIPPADDEARYACSTSQAVTLARRRWSSSLLPAVCVWGGGAALRLQAIVSVSGNA